MPRFDVFRVKGPTEAYAVGIQDSSLDFLPTRVVVPLSPEHAYPAIRDLNPTVEFDGRTWILLTQEPATVSRSRLRYPVGQLSDYRDEIVRAFDRLLTGV